MKQLRAQCTYKNARTHAHCTSRIWKAGEGLCIKHDIRETLQTAALDRVLKYHAKHCTYWIFSGDRHCSCGRDAAILELDQIRGRLRAVSGPNITKDHFHNKSFLPDRRVNESFSKSGDEKEV